jgi:hypothetical protein
MSTATPSPMPTPDLAGLLAKPPRLPNRSRPASEPPVEPAQTAIAAPGETPGPTPRRVPVASTKPRQLKPERPDDSAPRRQYLRSIAVYLPRSTHQAVAEKAEAAGTTRTALILAAVNATHKDLGVAPGGDDHVDGEGDLFDIPQRKAPSELTVQTSIRVTDRQLKAIDDLVARHGMNRSRLLTEALKLYLVAGETSSPLG